MLHKLIVNQIIQIKNVFGILIMNNVLILNVNQLNNLLILIHMINVIMHHQHLNVQYLVLVLDAYH
jgi:hypothetical protein